MLRIITSFCLLAMSFHLTAQSCYDIALTEGKRYYNQGKYAKAIEVWQNGKKCSKTEVKILDQWIWRAKDTDGDGVVNGKDKCPSDYAKTSNGCPDQDGDGVPDAEDNCPDVPGFISKKGCPELESDQNRNGVPGNEEERTLDEHQDNKDGFYESKDSLRNNKKVQTSIERIPQKGSTLSYELTPKGVSINSSKDLKSTFILLLNNELKLKISQFGNNLELAILDDESEIGSEEAVKILQMFVESNGGISASNIVQQGASKGQDSYYQIGSVTMNNSKKFRYYAYYENKNGSNILQEFRIDEE